MSSTPTIAVIGSLNIDFITTTPRIPSAGETMTASSFTTGFGGKGANQAVACSRLSKPRPQSHSQSHSVNTEVKTQMIGFLGSDSFGSDYLSSLKQEGIDTSLVQTIQGATTGVANIIVEEGSGENRILLCVGANHGLGEKVVDLVPEGAEVVVFQLEIPLGLVLHNIKLASQKGKYVILNPAPAVQLPEHVYQYIDCLVMNESEQQILSGGKQVSMQSYLERGVKDLVIVTLGGNGVSYRTSRQSTGSNDIHVPGLKVKVVDTTAAGDTFVGALAVQIARNGGKTPDDPASIFGFANAAAAKTVEKAGAMAAIPYFDEVDFEHTKK